MLPPGLRPLKRRAYAIFWTGGMVSDLGSGSNSPRSEPLSPPTPDRLRRQDWWPRRRALVIAYINALSVVIGIVCVGLLGGTIATVQSMLIAGVLSYLRPRWRHLIDADHLVNV